MSRFVDGAIAVISAMFLLGACGGSGTSASSTVSVTGYPPTKRSVLASAAESLCTVRAQAAKGDAAARATFDDRAHEALHIIAGAAAKIDRAVSAAFLVAKQRVEADFQATTMPASTPADVDALLAAAQHATKLIDVRPPRCS